MTTVYSNSPYYDDFDPAKKFYRILFRPGRAVQARELTQLQTILQNQIEQFGRNIYKNGTKISGGEPFFLPGNFVKIKETSNIAGFVGQKVTGATSGAKAIVKQISNSFAANANTFPSALHVVYTTGLSFDKNESITIDGTATSVTSQEIEDYSGKTYFVSINSGIYFIKGHFVYTDAQTVVVSKTFKELPSAVVGYTATETVVTSDDDESLLDPAVGTNNYFAPGADRYSIDLTLTSFEYDSNVQGAISSAVTDPDFIKIISIENASVISVNRNTTFNSVEDFVAKRTFDESGDYTVKPFVGKIIDHKFANAELVSVELSPGKAYVRGFEFENISSSYLDIERARDSEFVNGYSIDLSYGRNLTVQNVIGYSNFVESQEVQLFGSRANTVSASNATVYFNNPSAIQVGNARVHFLDTTNLDTYNLYLFDIRINSGNTFSDTKSFVAANVMNGANVILFSANVLGNAEITYTADDTYLFPIPQENIKTFKTGGVSDTTSLSFRSFPSTSFVSTGTFANAVLSLGGNDSWVGSGVLSDAAINARYHVVVTSASGNPPYPGNVLSFAGGSGEVIISGTQSAKLVFVGTQNFVANIVALVSTSSDVSKVKTLTTNTLSFHHSTTNTAILNLYKTDVVSVESIKDSANVSYLGSYRLDNGQRDDFYDHARLIFTGNISEANANVFLDASNPTLNVSFSYYSHSGTGYFNVDSYIDGGTDWGEIPTYTNSAGVPRRLSDVIDYRPVRTNDTDSNVITFVNSYVNSPDDTLTADFYFYLPRKDRLVLTKDRKFVILKGTPSKAPEAPLELSDAMTLYTFNIPAYTFNASDVKMVYVNNRRYTMRDIGKIEKRVDRLEYYTALSFLEKLAADERIKSAIPGVDRFKNGILVDSFVGHNVSDVRNADLSCSIDFENKYMRPRFSTNHVSFSLVPNDSTNIIREGDIITIDFNTTSIVEQIKATNVVNASPFDVFNYVGSMRLTPATDVWGDTTNNPSVTVNVNGENDAFTQITLDNTGLTPFGTKWNDWQSVFKGVTDVKVDVSSSVNIENNIKISNSGAISVTPKATTDTTARTTLTTQESSARAGLQFSSAAKTITSSLGEKVVDTSIIPFIRSKPITFVAQNLRPESTLFATFDGTNVSEYCFQASRLQLTNPTNNLPTTTVIETLSGATVVSQANVIFQRANVLYYQQNNQTFPFVTGNTVVLTIETGTLTGQVIDSVEIVENGTLQTDDFGICAGIFIIPNEPELRFNMGERAFKLADNIDPKFITTVAETKYLAYGLSTTKEETILATRMNLVSIDPLLQIKKSPTETSSTTTTNRTEVTGSSNEVQLPKNDPAVKQTFFCGEQLPAANGGAGESTYKVNLGTGVGLINVAFTVGIVPDRITATYNGEERSTGFITSLPFGPNFGNASQKKQFSDFEKRLQNLGFPGISPSFGKQAQAIQGKEEIVFIKQKATAESMILKVDAPLKGTAWSFKVGCPAGTTNPSAGTGKVYQARNNFGFASRTVFFNNDPRRIRFSGNVDFTSLYYIENTATNPRFTFPGAPTDKSIIITQIQVLRKNRRNSKFDGEITIDLNPTFVLKSGTTFPGFSLFDIVAPTLRIGQRPHRLSINQGKVQSIPITIPAGQGRDFGVRFRKENGRIINEDFIVRVTAEGPDGKKVALNDSVVSISTSDLTPPVPKDPLAQTFFVDGRTYEQGVFVSSIDLWFRKRAAVTPILVEIRPVVNGYPSSLEILPFAQVVINPENVNASETFNVNNNTNFKFESPVYLPPGQYSFVVLAESTDYELYTARIGEFELNNPTVRVDKQPYIGSMFKSQNASTWTPEQTEDLTFRINICDFGVESTATAVFQCEAPTSNLNYDLINVTGDVLTFPNATLTQALKTTPLSSGIIDPLFTPYTLGTNFPFSSRKIVKTNTGNSLQFRFNLNSSLSTVAPILDINRLGGVLVRNIINDPENESPVRTLDEDQFSGGNADAKYITRRVVLNPGFEAQDIRVVLTAFLPSPSRIKVFAKVNAPGTIDFDSQNKYVEITEVAVVGDPTTAFAEHTFTTATGTILPNDEYFNTFAVKIVMLSTDPTQVPLIKDLRVLALEAE